ncbi:MAG: hypothetical protein Kow00128_07540 [Deltaproteobacteria bacterium]
MTAPFSYRRRVGFGDCDPARIYYTPRAFTYCVEAVEAWWEAVLSDSWTGLLARDGLEVRFFRARSEFARPLTVGQTVGVKVLVSDPGSDRIRFWLTGEDEAGERCFLADLAAGLYDRERDRIVPIPERDRERIFGYASAFGIEGNPLSPQGMTDPPPPPGRRTFPDRLFARARRVAFGDCTPAGSADLPKIVEYAVETVGEWFEKVPGVSWLELVSVRMQGAPAVSASCELYRPVTAGREMAMGVRVLRLGRASLSLLVEGNDPEEIPLFDVGMTVCFIDQRDGFRSMPVPEELRRRIESYRRERE